MRTLYDDVFSPYARKVRLALYEKDVPFELVRALQADCNRTDFMASIHAPRCRHYGDVMETYNGFKRNDGPPSTHTECSSGALAWSGSSRTASSTGSWGR